MFALCIRQKVSRDKDARGMSDGLDRVSRGGWHGLRRTTTSVDLSQLRVVQVGSCGRHVVSGVVRRVGETVGYLRYGCEDW
jgi:hypothetical protein